MYQEAKAEEATEVDEVLDEVRNEISADDDDLREARERRKCVLEAAASFDGFLRKFNSGSVAHGTVNNLVDDADGGVVLNRQVYPDLGPDSDDEGGPAKIVAAVRDHIMPIVRETYPDAEGRLTKRAILIRFKEPNDDEVDPSVDLIVGLTRKDADGIWIPNLDRDKWDASDPEEHTRLLTAKPKDLRVHRARIIRLAKAAVKHDSSQVLISFNIEALALEQIEEVDGLTESLRSFFDEAASSIGEGLTEDPAEVSGAIKLPEGMTRTRAAKRLQYFADKVQEAVDADDRAGIEAALAELYLDQFPDAGKSEKKSLVEALRSGDEGHIRKSFAAAPAAALKPKARSHGNDAHAA